MHVYNILQSINSVLHVFHPSPVSPQLELVEYMFTHEFFLQNTAARACTYIVHLSNKRHKVFHHTLVKITYEKVQQQQQQLEIENIIVSGMNGVLD